MSQSIGRIETIEKQNDETFKDTFKDENGNSENGSVEKRKKKKKVCFLNMFI